MAKTQLTERQRNVYELIRSLIQSRGYGPTVREIGEHFEIKSPNGVMCHLRALEKKGLITRKANKSRAIELTGEHARSVSAMPLLGIVSEHPSTVEAGSTHMIDLGSALAIGERFVVQVSGNSFSERGIHDGDYLIVDSDREGKQGDLIVRQLPSGQASLSVWGDRPGGGEDMLGVAVSMVREAI